MNKIVVEQKKLVLQDEDVLIDHVFHDLVLNVRGRVNCGIQNIIDGVCLTIYLEENSTLLLDFLLDIKAFKNKIVIYSATHSKLNLNYACTYSGKNVLEIESHIASSCVGNNIKIRAVEENGSLEVKATGIIEEGTTDTLYLEDIKAITTHNNSITIQPDLVVKTNEVIANHNATISTVDENELFYLRSKGISKEKAISLIKDGFLKGILSIEEIKNK